MEIFSQMLRIMSVTYQLSVYAAIGGFPDLPRYSSYWKNITKGRRADPPLISETTHDITKFRKQNMFGIREH